MSKQLARIVLSRRDNCQSSGLDRCPYRGIYDDVLCFFFAWSTWSAVSFCELVNIGRLEDPVSAGNLFSLDGFFLRKLTHSAGRQAKHGGDFFNVHQLNIPLHTVECT